MAALPYMRMYWADYDADTAHLTTMQHGIYLLLIKNYWQRGGPLPNDELRLARIAKVNIKDWRRNEGVILEFFTKQENLLVHKRVALELSHVEAKSLKAKASALANAKRTQGKRPADDERTPTYTEADTDIEKKEEQVGGKPPDYAFFGQTIKLKPRDFSEWKRLFHTILDLEAELSVLDGWWQDQPAEKRKSWFHGTKAMLNKKHQTNLVAAKEAEEPAGWNGFA
jgi:uncharacterized protein YdaU (DUF1376 family)